MKYINEGVETTQAMIGALLNNLNDMVAFIVSYPICLVKMLKFGELKCISHIG